MKMNREVIGDTEIIYLLEEGAMTSIYNNKPIVHIIGKGQTVRIIPDNPKGVAIGNELTKITDTIWTTQGMYGLLELRVENINLIIESSNDCFSLGVYNEQNNVKITKFAAGFIDCPEVKGQSTLLYKAEPAINSIGFTGDAKYVLVSKGESITYCDEQLNEIRGDAELMRKVTPHTTPTMIRFIRDTGITPSSGFYDENIPKAYVDMMRAALAFGIDSKKLWSIYKSVYAYRIPTMLRKHIREAMYDMIYPDWRDVKDEIFKGKLYTIYDLSKEQKPNVTRDNLWMYKYLIPPIGVEDTIENLRDALGLECEPEREHALSMFIEKKFKFRDKVTTKRIPSLDKDLMIWECGKMACGILIYDCREKLTLYCNTMFPFMTVMKMHGDTVFQDDIMYSTQFYVLNEDYKWLKKSRYVINENMSTEVKTVLEDAVSKGIAVLRKDGPILNYKGRGYYFEVLDYI